MRRRRGLPLGLRVLLWLLCLPLLVLALAMATLSLLPDLQQVDPLTLVASFAPLGVLAGALAAVLATVLLASPRRLGPAVALLLALVTVVGPIAPTLRPLLDPPPPAGAPSLTVVSLNTLAGRADPDSIAAAAEGADVVVLVEVTPEALDALGETSLPQQLPHRSGEQDELPGAVVWSRYPVSTLAVEPLSFQQRLVSVEVPDLGPVSVLAAHPVNPLAGSRIWAAEHQRIRELAAAAPPPTLVVGDLNAVDQHREMSRWRAEGWTDAGHSAGAGWVRTWPTGADVPPLIGIDHVLTGPGLRGTSLQTFEAPGSDHRGLRAEVAATGD